MPPEPCWNCDFPNNAAFCPVCDQPQFRQGFITLEPLNPEGSAYVFQARAGDGAPLPCAETALTAMDAGMHSAYLLVHDWMEAHGYTSQLSAVNDID